MYNCVNSQEKKSETIELHFLTILGLAELFKTMNRPDSNRPGQTAMPLDGSYFGEYKR